MDRNWSMLVKPRAIALIVKEPVEIYLDFLSKFKHYDIYIIIDSLEKINTNTYQNKYKNINFIQFDEQLCKNNGYQNVNYIGIKKMISGWDKALLFFSLIIPLKYKNVWFIEDDVFFLSEQVLTNLDAKYPNQDLIANCDFNNTKVTTNNKSANNKSANNESGNEKDNKNNDWLWPQIDIKIEKPWFAGMMCAVRASSALLQGIKWYATTYKTLFFLEALFPTITSHFKLSYVQPDELTTVTYRREFNDDEDSSRLETHIFHPIKDLKQHLSLRQNYIVNK
jgi:hypothetical protein